MAYLREGDTTQHGDYELRYSTVDTGGPKYEHMIEAHHLQDGPVGYMAWNGSNARVRRIEVHKDHQRQGIASAMWDWGQAMGRPKPKHSAERTDTGDAWARSVGGPLPRRQSMYDYFRKDSGDEGNTSEPHLGGRGKPRHDVSDPSAGPGGDQDRAGAAPVGGDTPDVESGEGSARSVEFHPGALKDLRALDKPVQRQIMGVIDDMASGGPAQTHALGEGLPGWLSTKASRGHRIIHRNTQDGGIHVGYIGLHDYSKARRRLLSYFVVAQGPCVCCGGSGEHPTGHECYYCDASGRPDADERHRSMCDEVFRNAEIHAHGCPHCGGQRSCPCGTPVAYDPLDGWQHEDGSISHDGEYYGQSVSDLMKTSAHERPDWADDDFTAKDGSLYHVVTEPNAVSLRTPEGRLGGYVNWGEVDGVIGNMNVSSEHQRRGLATELLRRAKEQRPDLEHSHRLSNDAQAWISGMDGKTSAHTAPTSRVFGPTFGLDHRLFEGERLRSEVRTAVMARLGPVLEPLLGQDWQTYTRVYLAGSEASEWTSATLEGNGDFDTLLGIDYDHARDIHLPLGGLDDADITDMVNTALRTAYNASPWKAPFGSDWDLTGYCNAGSWDITKIKPYAAYNISDDVWAVKPPHLPDWGIDKLPEGGANLLAEAEGYASVIEAIEQMPEPYQTQQGKALWHHLHTDRGRAFSAEGEGWMDPGNLIEKALVEWGLWDKLVEWQYGKKTAGKAVPQGVTFEHRPSRRGDEHTIIARHPDAPNGPFDNYVGHLTWFDNDGQISGAWVHKDWQRKGVGTEMLRQAREIHPEVHHAPEGERSDEGQAWINTVGTVQKAAMGARGDLPDGITYEHELKDGIHVLQARHPDMPDENKFAGLLSWWDKDGEIGSAEVHPEMQRRGLATELLRRAKEITPHIHHSDYLTPEAKGWISGMEKNSSTGRIYSRGRMRLSDISIPGEGQLSPRPYSQRQLAADIKRNGITEPIAIHTSRHPETGQWVHNTINGMHRIDAGRRAGVQDTPVVVSHPYEAEPPLLGREDATEQEFNDVYDTDRSGKWASRTAVRSGALDLPQEQHDALEAEPYSASKRKLLELAKKPVAGTHIWRGEVRSGDPAEGMRQSGVGMHWTVNPSSLLHPYTHEADDRNIVWHGEIEHPEQGIPRGHSMWRGVHQSMDSEAEVRFKPGTKVKVHGYWMKDPDHPEPGYLAPRFPEHTGPGWSYHSVGEHATVSHKPRTDLIDYGDVGIPKDAKIIDITAYFKTAEDNDYDESHRLQHRPPDRDGIPIHDLTKGMPEDVYTHPHYYDHGGEGMGGSYGVAHRVVVRVRNKPEARVKIYRSLPADHVSQGFRPGDWVSTSSEYARQHGRHSSDPKQDWPVIATMVKADDLHTDADDLREYGYNGEHKPDAMVSYKGGYHEEVRHDTGGKIVRVKRRAPKTAMPAKNHPPTEDFTHEIHDLDWDDNNHAMQEQDWPGWNHKILYGKVKGQLAGHIIYSENPHGTAISVGKMETSQRHQGKGVASAMQDALTEEHPTHWINHGSRTGPGVRWWDSYEDPAEHRNIHNHPHEQWMDHFDIGQEHDDPDRVFGERERPAPEGGLKFEHVKGKDAYIGGVVKWRPPHGQEDHDAVHDRDNYDHDQRADVLLNAASEQNALGHGQFHEDVYSARDHAHELAEAARKTHNGPVTSFVMHKDEGDEYPTIGVQSHQPGEELHAARTQRLDTEYHYHPVHTQIARTALRILSYFGMAA